MPLTVYADFNCPYSALASWRVDRAGLADAVAFRTVEHDPDIPLDGKSNADLHAEVEEVLGLVTPADGEFALNVPDVVPNTSIMCAAYAASPSAELRRAFFDAVWRNGAVAATTAVEGTERKGEWQAAWEAFGDKKIVPMLVLEDGYVSRGLGALERLAKLL